MEPIFENSYIRDKSTANEIGQHYYFKRPLPIVLTAIYIICFAVNLTSLLCGYGYSTYGLIIPPVFVAFWFYSYFMFKKSLTARDAEIHKGDILINMQVYEDHITAKGPDGSAIELEYNNVKKTVTTKNYFVFISKARLMYIFKKDSFTKGELADFARFINSKGIKIKNK